MPFQVGSVATHDDGQHTGSAKRDTASGVAGLDAGGNLLALGYALALTRDGAGDMTINDRTAAVDAMAITRIGANDYDAFVVESGARKQIQTESMKNIASGIAGLDASVLLALTQQRLNFKLGSFLRDMTAVSGNVAYTGVGFVPRLILFWGGVGTSIIFSLFGAADGTNNFVIHDYHGATADTYREVNNMCIYLAETSVNQQYANLASFDADGFTLTWTKNATPSAGSARIYYIAIR